MTLAATWCSYEPPAPPRLWMASDSRISDDEAPLIDQGLKLFEVPIICRAPGPTGFFDQIVFESAIGLVAAGGSLVFQHVYGSLVPLLANLIRPVPVVPSTSQLASFVGRVMTIYVRSLGHRRHDAGRVMIIVGGESLTGQASAYKLIPQVDTQDLLEFVPMQLELADGVVHFIGDRTDEAQSMYRDIAMRDEPGASRQRAALNVIRNFIDDPEIPSVGGEVQIGYSAGGRFRRVASVVPGTEPPPSRSRYLLNSIDLEELGSVGDCALGIDAVAIV